MSNTERVMPTHIIAVAGIVINDNDAFCSIDKAQELITAPAIIERFKAYLEYAGRPTYLEYVTKPNFQLKLKRSI